LEIVARNALTKGLPIEVIHDITGLDLETIKQLMNQPCRASALYKPDKEKER
jgi:hypothetical protein